MQPSLEANLKCIRRRIGDAAVRAGRRAGDVHLLAVTKSVTPNRAAELARLGQLDLGESRADDIDEKAELFARLGLEVRWHFVGHLQSNKARRVVVRAQVIHSVDSLGLLATIDRLAGELGRRPELFLQVKLYPEPLKSGLDPAEVPDVIAATRDFRNVELRGLMTMAPLVESSGTDRAEAAGQVFEALSALARGVEKSAFRDGRVCLSMGMSDDFEIAIAAGSDWVRIGSSLFDGLPVENPGLDHDPSPAPSCGSAPGEVRS